MSRVPRPRAGTYKYACGCTNYFSSAPPKIGDELICRNHGETFVIGTAAQWIAKCTEAGCTFEYPYGEFAKLAAERGAAMHRRRKSGKGHVVQVWDPKGVLYRTFDGAGAADAPADW